MSLQVPILVIAGSADLVAGLREAGASSVIEATWAGAAKAFARTPPAAIVIGQPEPPDDQRHLDRVVRAIAEASPPYLPVIAPVVANTGPIMPDALPIAANASAARIVARLGAALRVRALHATVLRRAAARGASKVPALAQDDPLDDATVLVTGRGRTYPTLTTAVGERVGLIGAMSVETAARYLNARDVDGIIVGEGFGPPTVEAFLTALSEDPRFRDLPVALIPDLPSSLDASKLPNLERLDGEPADVVERLFPLVRLHAFEARLKRQLKALETKGTIDPQTGLFTVPTFLRDLARTIEDARAQNAPISVARFSFPPGTEERSSIDAARLVSRMVRNIDFACRASDGSILLAFSGTALRSAHVVARRIASVLRHTMLAAGPSGGRIDPTVTLACLKSSDTIESLLTRISEPSTVAAE
jgi:GGDEF domain-containing protein